MLPVTYKFTSAVKLSLINCERLTPALAVSSTLPATSCICTVNTIEPSGIFELSELVLSELFELLELLSELSSPLELLSEDELSELFELLELLSELVLSELFELLELPSVFSELLVLSELFSFEDEPSKLSELSELSELSLLLVTDETELFLLLVPNPERAKSAHETSAPPKTNTSAKSNILHFFKTARINPS